MADKEFNFSTLCLHAGQIPDSTTGSRAAPIYQTTSFVFDSPEHAASLFNLQTFGNVYSRISNPTVAILEERVAALEGGRAALATASGQSAESVCLLTLLKNGDEIVSSSSLYGGTYSLFDVTFRQFGINTTFVEPDNIDNFERAITEKTRVIYGETIGNPRGNILDLEKIASIANKYKIPFIVDNTLASPYLCKPISFGADIVLHSATKFLGGHGTTMGGVIVESGNFDWNSGKFPEMVEPSKGYHGVKFAETFGDFGFTMKARMEILRTMGPCLSPTSAWQILQGIETLHVRMDRHVSNALKVANFLLDHQNVSWVNFAGLESDAYHQLGNKYLKNGFGSIFTFGIKGGFEAGEKFITALQFISHLANVGDVKSLVIHPASTTHRQLNEEEQINAGVAPDMVRLSIGIEDVKDIIWDIDQALNKSQI